MKTDNKMVEDMPAEVDFSGAVRGHFAGRLGRDIRVAVIEDDYEMKPEYELKNGKPNPYAERMRRGSNLVLIEPDLYAVFPSSEAVNEALRLIVKASAKAVKTKAVKPATAS